jgi:hypothetical protein
MAVAFKKSLAIHNFIRAHKIPILDSKRGFGAMSNVHALDERML